MKKDTDLSDVIKQDISRSIVEYVSDLARVSFDAIQPVSF